MIGPFVLSVVVTRQNIDRHSKKRIAYCIGKSEHPLSKSASVTPQPLRGV